MTTMRSLIIAIQLPFSACVQLFHANMMTGGVVEENSTNLVDVECDDSQMKKTLQLLKAGRYSELAGSPCIPAETLQAWKSGSEDLQDAWEFLGTDIGCSSDGEFFHPGPCGAQMPTTGCTKTQLPSVLYLGMPHSGSTSLTWELNVHPNLSYGMTKEHSFFTTPGPDWKGMKQPRCNTTAQELSSCRNRRTYKQEFLVDCNIKHTFDGTPNTIYLGRESPNCSMENTTGCPINYHWRKPGRSALQEMRSWLGSDLKLITMMRDPVDMCESMYGARALDNIDIRGCYADFIEGWLDVFPRNNFLFLDFQEYVKEPQAVLDKVFDFLAVPRKQHSEIQPLGRRRNTNKILSDNDRKEYHSTKKHKSCKKRLEALTGLKFDWKMA